MKLGITESNVIEIRSDGAYTVPDDVPMPLLIERFKVEDGNIIQVNEMIGMSNSQVAKRIDEIRLEEQFISDRADILSRLISITAKKILDVEKLIVDKQNITDNELETLKSQYSRKYKIAKEMTADSKLLDYQASEIGIPKDDLAAYIILEYERSVLLSNMTFDVIEAERLKIGKTLSSVADGTDAARRMIVEFQNRDPQHYLDKCVV